MNLHFPRLPWRELTRRARGMFNLNDPRWGRGGDESGKDGGKRAENDRGQGPNAGPPDLDELWRDFNRKLGGLFGGRRRGGGDFNGGGGGGGFPPDMRRAGIGAGLVVAGVVVTWLGT